MMFKKKINRAIASVSPSMAPSLSSLFLSSAFPTPTPDRRHLSLRTTLPPHPQTLSFSTNSTRGNNLSTTPPPPSPPLPPSEENSSSSSSSSSSSPSTERKSFSIITGELFLGIAARLLKTSNKGFSQNSGSIPVLEIPRKKSRNGGGVQSNGRYDEERIGVVMKDEIEPDVIWEQRVKDIEAEKKRRVVTSPGFSFSAAGLLFPYHLGVAQYLIEKGYIKETTPLAGSSAGAIVCAVIASGATMQDALKATKVLAEDCRLKGTAFRLGAVLRDVLYKFLPDDVHTRSNGRVRVAVTQILWKPKGLLVDQFDSKEDLINAVITSSFVPGYLAPRPATMYRNRLCIDGGLTLFMPPTFASKTVRVCAFPAARMGLEGIGISPDCNPENRASPRELFNWALEPAEDHILDRLFELGYLDAAVWAAENPVDKVVEDSIPTVENGSAN